ncbi:MAG: MFS transporter [Actinobacteria bacterium]|nr:MFS transporter [Actinomycetota bacterium]
MVAPILGRYAERYGASGFQVGLLFATFSLAQFVFSPILGRLSDRIGRKPVILISLCGTAIGSFITGAAGALWVLFLGRAIDGASGASVSVAQGAITDIAPPEQRAKLLGMLGAAFGAGFVLGPAVGGLAALGGSHVPFYVASAIAAINAIAAWIRLPETHVDRTVKKSVDVKPRVLTPIMIRFAAIGFISTAAFSGFEATFSLFGGERFNGLAVLATAQQWVVLGVALALLAIGQGLASPSITTLVVDAAGEQRRGEALGYQQSANALARIIGPAFAGLLFDRISTGTPYAVGAVFSVIAAVLFLTRGRVKNQ